MRRHLLLAVASGTLVLGACSDKSPTEPTVPPPSETFGTSCRVTPFPLAGVNGVANQINNIFSGQQKAQVLLRAAALLQAGAIKLLWDTCHPAAAKRAAFAFIDWLNRHTPVGKEARVQTLILTILRGVGEVTAPESSGDFGVGFFDPASTENTLIKTVNGHALVELEPGSFLVPTEIVISRTAADPPLIGFGGRQFPPTFDYNAINSTNNHVLQPGKTAIVAFCLLPLEGGYPANLRIGHNPVVGAPGFPFEILDPVNLVAEGLRDDLNCPAGTLPDPELSSSGGEMLDLANAALRTAGRYLLPPPLWATALVPLPPPPPIGGKARSLSPFRVVEVANDAGVISNGTVSLGVNPEGNLIVPGAGSISLGTGTNNGTTDVGLRFNATNAEALAIGVLTEGWGVAAGAVAGYANRAQGAPFNMTVQSFTRTATTAKSVVDIGSTLRVTHEYQPTTTPNLYKVDVAIQNRSELPLTNVVYRRVMDWDIEPTAFSEFVSVRGATSTPGVSTSDNGPAASANPLDPRGGIQTGDFSAGPDDLGAVFDLKFNLESGATKTFVLYYGAAANTDAAKAVALSAAVEVLSLARPNPNVEPHSDGSPNTFIAAFKGLGGPVLTAPAMVGMLRLTSPSLRLSRPSGQVQQQLQQRKR